MVYTVIPAGGSGTRLWPLSRATNPKFLHSLTGTMATLLQATVQRLTPLAPIERTFVVTGVAHAAAVARQLPNLPGANIVVEPSPKDSCAAIALAAAIIARQDPTAVMGSFAADHLVHDVDRFHQVVRVALEGAKDGFLMTVGITPTHPETGYGYLQCGDLLGAVNGDAIRQVAKFTEKPPWEVAEAYLQSGQYLWNASMFIWQVDAFLAELKRQQPELYTGLTSIAAAWSTPDQDRVLGEIWPELPKISVDVAVMEGAAAAGKVATVPGDFGWNDVGDYHSLGDLLPDDGHRNVVVNSGPGGQKPDILMLDSRGVVVVPHSGRLIAALGLQDMIIVDTADAVLVCPRDRAQEVKRFVDVLKDRGESRLL
jgi:mannose-1-phosphate guanylyltransferase